MGRRKLVVINSYEIAREALVTKGKDFAGRPPHYFGSIFGRDSTDIAFQTFSAGWKAQHKMVMSALRLTEHKANVDLYIENLCEIFRSFHETSFNPRDPVFTTVGGCLASMIFGEELKINESELQALIEALHIFATSLAAANLVDTFPIFKYIPIGIIKKAKRAGEYRDELFERKYQEHVATFQKDNIRSVIDAMLKDLRENCGNLLAKKHLISSASDIFMPGTETPSAVLIWILFYAVKYPDVQARLHNQLDDAIGKTSRLPELSDKPNLPYLEAFIAEVQRIVSETPLAVPHSTTRDTSLAGFFIPRDMTVFVNLWAIHHDPDNWEDPFCFRPERFLDDQGRLRVEGIMPFSAGTRSCPGEGFSRRAVFLFAARLLYRFKFVLPDSERLPDEEESDYGIVLNCKPFKVCALTRRN